MPEPMIYANLLHLSYNMWGDWDRPRGQGQVLGRQAVPAL